MQDIQKYPTVTSFQLQQADPNLEKEKKSIYNHPLYPLLSLLLEQCEQATASPDSPAPDTFEADLQSYVQRNESNEKFFLTDNKELDSLMVKAIQVMRIHLIELRKVNELCKDFCARYINCLKTKIHSDSIFDDSEESSPNGSERLSPTIVPGSGSAYNSPYSSHAGSIGRGYLDMNANHRHQHLLSGMSGIGPNSNMVDCVDYMNGSNSSPPMSGMSPHEEITNNNYLTSISSGNSTNYHNILDPSKQKRGVLPKKATQIMKQWLFQHLVHPYPTEDEKRQIANQTNLTLLQVNNWFINARRRILQPMLDSTNSPGKEKNTTNQKHDKSDTVSETDENNSGMLYGSSCGSRKKKAATNRPSNNRFWPASLAAAVNMLSSHSSMGTTCTVSSPMTTVASGGSTPKMVSQVDQINNTSLQYSDHNPSHNKRLKLNTSDPDVYQPPKLLNQCKDSYEPYICDFEYKSLSKDTKSRSSNSTPHYTELSSPANSKTNSVEESADKTKQDLPPHASQVPSIRVTNSPKVPSQRKCIKNEFVSPYFSADPNTTNLTQELSSVNLFPSNTCPYATASAYANMIMPQPNSYLAHSAALYNASLQRVASQNDPNSSMSLFGMRHSNNHSFPISDPVFSGYENFMEKRNSMVSHINDLFTPPNNFNRSWDEHNFHRPYYNSYDNSSNLPVKPSDFPNNLSEPVSTINHSYPHLDTFPNFSMKAFHAKSNTN